MLCPHCEKAVFQTSPSKLKARTKILVIHKSGEIEIGCPECKRGILLPLLLKEGAFEIRKAPASSLVILDRKARTTS